MGREGGSSLRSRIGFLNNNHLNVFLNSFPSADLSFLLTISFPPLLHFKHATNWSNKHETSGRSFERMLEWFQPFRADSYHIIFFSWSQRCFAFFPSSSSSSSSSFSCSAAAAPFSHSDVDVDNDIVVFARVSTDSLLLLLLLLRTRSREVFFCSWLEIKGKKRDEERLVVK